MIACFAVAAGASREERSGEVLLATAEEIDYAYIIMKKQL